MPYSCTDSGEPWQESNKPDELVSKHRHQYDLYKEIRKLDDTVKVCFLTASEVYDEGLRDLIEEMLDEVKCFISKPLTIEDLVRKVKKEVEGDSQ